MHRRLKNNGCFLIKIKVCFEAYCSTDTCLKVDKLRRNKSSQQYIQSWRFVFKKINNDWCEHINKQNSAPSNQDMQ